MRKVKIFLNIALFAGIFALAAFVGWLLVLDKIEKTSVFIFNIFYIIVWLLGSLVIWRGEMFKIRNSPDNQYQQSNVPQFIFAGLILIMLAVADVGKFGSNLAVGSQKFSHSSGYIQLPQKETLEIKHEK